MVGSHGTGWWTVVSPDTTGWKGAKSEVTKYSEHTNPGAKGEDRLWRAAEGLDGSQWHSNERMHKGKAALNSHLSWPLPARRENLGLC